VRHKADLASLICRIRIAVCVIMYSSCSLFKPICFGPVCNIFMCICPWPVIYVRYVVFWYMLYFQSIFIVSTSVLSVADKGVLSVN